MITMNILTKIFFSLLSFLCLTAMAEELDRIVAIVNEGVILESELDKNYEVILLAAAEKSPSRREVLETMVLRQVQLDVAKRLNLYISEEEQELYIQSLLAQNQMTREEYESQLLARGTSYAEWRREISGSLLIGKLQRRQLREYIRINDKEIDDFLLDNMPAALKETRYDLVHFLISVGEASQADIEALVAQLSDINERAELLAYVSSLPYQETQANDFGVKQLAELPAPFAREVPLMRTGDIRHFRLESSWHIIKALNVIYPKAEYRVEYKLSGIPMLQNILFTDEQLQVRIDDIYKQLLEGADFRDLAEIYSDPNNLLSNYELDWVGVDALPQRIRRLLSSSQIGSFSKPFFMDNGWYILLTEDRRERDVSLDLLREQAYNIIANRKLSQSLPFWLNDIQSQAHIQYLLTD